MASHCSILAWKIPWTEDPCGRDCLSTTTSFSMCSSYHLEDRMVMKRGKTVRSKMIISLFPQNLVAH